MLKRTVSGIILTFLLVGILASAFVIQSVKAEVIVFGQIGTIHWGSGIVKDSQHFNFGTGDIFWSIANEERGYFYGSSFSSPTVFFADKIDDYWGSYDSYQGVQYVWEFTNASDHEWFTQHGFTFAEETSLYYTGILLFRQGGLYGAIKPKSIHNGDLNHPENYVLEFDWWYDDSGGSDFSILESLSSITATVDSSPQTLNLRSKGRWIAAFIELPEDYNVADINVSSIMLNNTIPAELRPLAIEDYDEDGVPDLMVKFNRAQVTEHIIANVNMTELVEERFMTITLTITGYLYDDTLFQGSDTIRIMKPPPRRGGGRYALLK